MDNLPTMTDEEFSAMLDGSDTSEPLLVYFNFTHLVGANRAVTKAYAEMAAMVLVYGEPGPQRTTAFQKLLEALDATRRSMMPTESVQ